jgi:hypothetical protein
MILVVVATVLLLSACVVPTHVDYHRELVALNVRDGVSGAFFLGSGSISSSPAYVFAEKGTDGLVAIKTVRQNEAVYKEDVQGDTPYVEHFKCDSSCDNRDLPETLKQSERIGGYYVFHIPKGSLVSTYDLGFSKL